MSLDEVPKTPTARDHVATLFQWLLLGAQIGVLTGGGAALFLFLLQRATSFRETHEIIVYALPIAGLAIGAIYEKWGSSIKGGNNLVLDTIHDGSPQIPLRMGPMVVVGTVLTHLFGGSAGREGTAVQMGASLADFIAHRARASKKMRRQLLAAGMAGGFGAVFGTPLAGAIFGLEVVAIGRFEIDALLPALVASVVGDMVCRFFGTVHTTYPQVGYASLTPLLIAKLVGVAAIMAAVTTIFIELTERSKKQLERRIPRLPVRMFVGGLVVLGLWKVVGTSDYLGLGIPMILRSFRDPDLPTYAFAAKLVFTSITLASGFLGGEVTPLFFVGATLGSVLARLFGFPIELGAGVGLAAVFGAAANAPLALSIMAVELVGPGIFPHVFLVCIATYLLTGHRGIYPSQRIYRKKHGFARLEHQRALRHFHAPSSPPRSSRRGSSE